MSERINLSHLGMLVAVDPQHCEQRHISDHSNAIELSASLDDMSRLGVSFEGSRKAKPYRARYFFNGPVDLWQVGPHRREQATYQTSPTLPA